VIFDRRPFYLIGGAVAALFVLGVYFFVPRVTPEQRVQEQLVVLAKEPWVRVRVEDVQYRGAGQPDQALVRGQRLDTGTPVLVHFLARSPYTSPAAMRHLAELGLAGCDAEVLMLPRSIAHEPYRSQFDAGATHVGVAFFAGVPEPEPGSAPAGAAAASTEGAAQSGGATEAPPEAGAPPTEGGQPPEAPPPAPETPPYVPDAATHG
jgi:hypothetical protein